VFGKEAIVEMDKYSLKKNDYLTKNVICSIINYMLLDAIDD